MHVLFYPMQIEAKALQQLVLQPRMKSYHATKTVGRNSSKHPIFSHVNINNAWRIGNQTVINTGFRARKPYIFLLLMCRHCEQSEGNSNCYNELNRFHLFFQCTQSRHNICNPTCRILRQDRSGIERRRCESILGQNMLFLLQVLFWWKHVIQHGGSATVKIIAWTREHLYLNIDYPNFVRLPKKCCTYRQFTYGRSSIKIWHIHFVQILRFAYNTKQNINTITMSQ